MSVDVSLDPADLEANAAELEKYKELSRKLAKLFMDCAAGDDNYNQAYRLIKKHFPKLYRSYE